MTSTTEYRRRTAAKRDYEVGLIDVNDAQSTERSGRDGLYNLSSDVSSRTWPRPRGASRTKSSGLGLDNKVLGLGPKYLARLALVLALR